MSKAGASSEQNEIRKLLDEIDKAVSVEDMGKEVRLSDARANLKGVQADLVGLRRMLVQHPKPDAPVQELNGQTIGGTIRDKIKQAKRLEDYINELEKLPDDPAPEDEADAKANGHAGLRAEDKDGRLDDTEREEVT